MTNFEKWWNEEGSAMRPMPTEDVEEFAKRVSQIAWLNGSYVTVRDVGHKVAKTLAAIQHYAIN